MNFGEFGVILSNDNEATPIFDGIGKNVKGEIPKFVEKAAKAVWAFICAFVTSLVAAVIPYLMLGRMPTLPEWLASIGIALGAAYGTGQAVYSVTNKG